MKKLHAILLFWVVCVLVGFGILYRYSSQDNTIDIVSAWPKESSIPELSGRPRLIFFLHPKCSCSLATVHELQNLLNVIGNDVEAMVFLIKPKGRDIAWAQDTLWKELGEIKGIMLRIDDEGKEAKLFKAQTSGEGFLFDENGKLLFQGGITPSRGHIGESAGKASIIAMIKDKTNQSLTSKIFGCGLL